MKTYEKYLSKVQIPADVSAMDVKNTGNELYKKRYKIRKPFKNLFMFDFC